MSAASYENQRKTLNFSVFFASIEAGSTYSSPVFFANWASSNISWSDINFHRLNFESYFGRKFLWFYLFVAFKGSSYYLSAEFPLLFLVHSEMIFIVVHPN